MSDKSIFSLFKSDCVVSENKKKGFTLAEVLVTLLVIGVVAALTIPQLIQSTAKNEYKAGLKKSLGALNQALALNIAQNAQEANDATISSAATLGDYFGRRMVVVSGAGTADFFTADGTQYTFARSAACAQTGQSIDTATCSVLVDVNGNKAPNALSTGNTTGTYAYNDRYQLVIRNNQILPSTNATNTAAVGAITEQ